MIGEVYRYLREGPHETGDVYTSSVFSDSEYVIEQGDVVIVVECTFNARLVMLPSGAIRYLGYRFEERTSDFERVHDR